MIFLNQKGAVQLIIILILVVGIVVGIYLVQQRTSIRPKAQTPVSGPIEVQNYCGQFAYKVVCGQKAYDTCFPGCDQDGRAIYNCYPTQDPRVCTGTIYCEEENYRCGPSSGSPSAVPNTNVTNPEVNPQPTAYPNIRNPLQYQ